MRFVAPVVTPRGLARRVPPAVFLPTLGLLALGIGWRQSVIALNAPGGPVEMFLGAVTLLYLFCLGAYLIKLMRRSAVFLEDLRLLPGRLGVSALVAGLYLLATVLGPYAAAPARGLLLATLGLHGAVIVVILWVFARGPAEARRYSPAGHLYFGSPMVGALAAAQAGYDYLSLVLLAATLTLSAGIWAWGADRLRKGGMAAALRPLVALHLTPVALAGLTAGYLGLETLALIAAAISAVLLAALVLGARWLTEASFSWLWALFCLPLAMTAGLWITLGDGWRMAGAILLVAASFAVLAIAFRVLKLWAGGQLAVRTNAAIA